MQGLEIEQKLLWKYEETSNFEKLMKVILLLDPKYSFKLESYATYHPSTIIIIRFFKHWQYETTIHGSAS